MALLGGMVSQRDRRLHTDSSTPLSSHNQHIPGIPAGPAPVRSSELTRWEHFCSGGTLGHCPLRSNHYQLTAPGKLFRKAARSLAGRMDIFLSYVSNFLLKTDYDLSIPAEHDHGTGLGHIFLVCAVLCCSFQPWLQYTKCLLGSKFLRLQGKWMWLFFIENFILFVVSSLQWCICVCICIFNTALGFFKLNAFFLFDVQVYSIL